MKVESIAERSTWSILQYFWPALSDNWSWKSIFGLFESGLFTQVLQGAQWLSGRVLDSRPKGCGFEPHRRHCVVVLEQDTFILA